MPLRYDIYLDTSVINFLFADDAPEKKAITIDFFDNFIMPGKYNSYVSNFVIEEINNTDNEEKRNKLLDVLQRYPVQLLEVESKEVEELSSKYLEAGVIPQKKIFDALHVATSTIYQIHFLVSWNYKHLANIN